MKQRREAWSCFVLKNLFTKSALFTSCAMFFRRQAKTRVGRAWSWMIQVTNQQRDFCEGHGWNHGWALQLTSSKRIVAPGLPGKHARLFAVIHLAEFLSLRFDPFFLHMTSVEIQNTPQSSNPTNHRFGFRRTHISLRLLQRVENPANHATCDNWRAIGPWGLWVDRCAATWNSPLSEAVGNQQSSITSSIVVYSQYLLLSVT